MFGIKTRVAVAPVLRPHYVVCTEMLNSYDPDSMEVVNSLAEARRLAAYYMQNGATTVTIAKDLECYVHTST